MRKLPLLLALITLGVSMSPSLPAQILNLGKDAHTDRLPVAPLPALWRFHPGDNAAWADPAFDDSGWSLLKSDRSWDVQGYKGSGSMGWYRFQVLIPENIEHVSFTLPEIWTSYEVFADGVKVGAYGKMPPNPSVYDGAYGTLIYEIPSASTKLPNAIRKSTVAIRIWQSPQAERNDSGGPLDADGVAGESAQIDHLRSLNLARSLVNDAGGMIFCILSAFAALGAFCLYLFRRREKEYLWFSLKMAGLACVALFYFSFHWHVWPDKLQLGGVYIWGTAGTLLDIAFVIALFRPRRGWLLNLTLACTFLQFVYNMTSVVFTALRGTKLDYSLDELLAIPCAIWILVTLYSFARRRSIEDSRWIDARLLFMPFLLAYLEGLLNTANWAAPLFLHSSGIFLPYDVVLLELPFPVSVSTVIDLVWMLGFFATLVFRFTRTRGEQERYATEIEGARSVQQFLIPAALPPTPGLLIESDYRPAREVGGDFFQIIPNKQDGSALILVGDVAGKGLQAGMLATLLVGAVRTAATFTSDPAVILGTINNRLHNQGNATALALHITAGGAATLVNAGHLPPYLNGRELPMEGALPLGTLPNIDFPILHFQLAPGDKLTLISDGILEAQKPDGELFGFERTTRHLAANYTASSLATAAQDFGQEDDITVLTIARINFAV